MKRYMSLMLAGPSLFVMAGTAHAQPVQGSEPNAATAAEAQDPNAIPSTQAEQANTGVDTGTEGEIVVEARRRTETLQDVPISLNVVNNQELQEQNIRRFEDVQTVVPGLSLTTQANGIGGVASVRGVQFDVNASGNNGTIEFYLNDAPISAGNLFQAVFDIGQIELLRGPQGTLRGRASPSGSMTVTTKKPDLDEVGGYVSGTANTIGGLNFQAGVGVPIIPGVLAVRVAGVIDDNEANRVRSVNNPVHPYSETRGGRISVRFDPTSNLTLNATYQHIVQRIRSFDQVETIGTAPLPIPFYDIDADDRLAVEDAPRQIKQTFDNFTWNAQWSFAGQRLNYTGAHHKQHFLSFEPTDRGDYFTGARPNPLAPIFPSPFGGNILTGFGQDTDSRSKTWAHELRLSSEERIGGMFDYIVGVFYQKTHSPTELVVPGRVFVNPLAFPIPVGIPGFGPVPANGADILYQAVTRDARTKEKSAFANLTAHIGEGTEIAGGVRYIKYESDNSLDVLLLPALIPTGPTRFDGGPDSAWIYMASIKHEFTNNFMAYANIGTSWRPGVNGVGNFSAYQSPTILSFTNLPPEKSRSIEAGIKASFLDRKGRLNLSVFRQKFKNYPRSSTGTFYLSCNAVNATNTACLDVPGISQADTFVAALPVRVTGVELDAAYQITPNWDFGLTFAYAKSKVTGGFIPCNDVNGDGIPDDPQGPPPTAGQLNPVTQIGSCSAEGLRVTRQPLWTAVFQSEYKVPISTEVDGFIRGLLTVNGDSQGDPTNPVDDVKRYALLNLFAGIRSPNGAWEASIFAKNIFNTDRVFNRRQLTTPFTNIGAGGIAQFGRTGYNGITMTQPREFGVTARYAFGSR